MFVQLRFQSRHRRVHFNVSRMIGPFLQDYAIDQQMMQTFEPIIER